MKLLPIQLGLCCMHTELRAAKPPVYPSRTMILKTVLTQGIDAVKEKALANLRDVLTILQWNVKNHIFVYRMSSDMFPHATNPAVPFYGYEFALPLLQEIGKFARDHHVRLTFHPGQYNVIGTPHAKAWAQTVADLTHHATLLDLMECGPDSVMVVHFGGVYGDKQGTIERWITQFRQLPQHVQRRLVLENCEKSFSIEDCLALSLRVNIPVVFDTHHHACYRQLHPAESLQEGGAYIPQILATWAKRNIKPKFHVSEQGEGKVGHHSDIVTTLPDYLLNIPIEHNVSIDIMIEAKAKEKALLYLFKKYHAELGYSEKKRKRDE